MKYVCSVCGYVHIGTEPPNYCPVCKVPADKFKKQAGLNSSDPVNSQSREINGRFEVASSQSLGDRDYVEVLRDKQTGILYLWRKQYDAGGLAVMVDRDGKPLTSSYKVTI